MPKQTLSLVLRACRHRRGRRAQTSINALVEAQRASFKKTHSCKQIPTCTFTFFSRNGILRKLRVFCGFCTFFFLLSGVLPSNKGRGHWRSPQIVACCKRQEKRPSRQNILRPFTAVHLKIIDVPSARLWPFPREVWPSLD